jgi:perosamine synthetase
MKTQSIATADTQVAGMAKRRIPVSEPMLDDAETRFLNDALKKGAISGFFGEYIPLFEAEFAKYCDCEYGVSVTNGTTALHLALAALSIGRDDEVLVASLTNMATFFAVLYQGARPVPIDVDRETLNVDPSLLEAKITPRTKAIIVVHLYGHPVDMDPILSVARKHKLYVIEDCAQAHGATYKGRKVGGLGDIGSFSFYANKVITTGEGGMITLNDKSLADRARSLKSLAFGASNKFMHHDIGYNYRMTNLQAAIGHAQFGKIETIIAAKRKVAARYHAILRDRSELELPVEKEYARNVYWMYHILVRGIDAEGRGKIMRRLADDGIETRENFVPYNMQEIFIKQGLTRREDCPIANDLGQRGFYLPSSPKISDEDITYVCDRLTNALDTR